MSCRFRTGEARATLPRMELTFLGHAAVLLSWGGESLLVDPYAIPDFGGRFRYRPIDVVADWVVSSHDHSDHSAVQGLRGSPRLVTSGVAGPFEISRHTVPHDEYGGRRRGGLVDILEIRGGGCRVVHLSDVGCAPPAQVIGALRGADVVLVPVGGNYTIGAAQAWEWWVRLAPRAVVPIHFRTPACSLPIREAEIFLSWCDELKPARSGPISIQEVLEPLIFAEPSRG